MQTTLPLICRLLIILVIPLVAGCGGFNAPSTIEVKDLGLSLKIPPGWRMERGNSRMLVDSRNPENHFGLIDDCPSAGKNLNSYVDDMTRMDAAGLRSRQALTIGGYPAIELVSEADFALLEVFIQKDNRMIRVSYRVEKEALPIQGPALRKSLLSIRFQ